MGRMTPEPGLSEADLHEWWGENARYDSGSPNLKYHVVDPHTSSRRLFSNDTRELWMKFRDIYFGKEWAYWANCTQFPESGKDFDRLVQMIEDEDEITYNTVRKHCIQLDYWAELMGYSADLKLKNDWGVTFHKSRYDGQVAYFVKHSAIEHIWLPRSYVRCHKDGTKIASPVGNVQAAGMRTTSRLRP